MKLNKNKLVPAVGMVAFVAFFVGMTSVTSDVVFAAEACNPSATTIGAAVCMQDINDSIIESMVTDEQYQLIDARDGRTYYIVRLQDGNVWMSQNLKLFLDKDTALTSETSDLNDGTSAAYQDGYSIEDGVIKWQPVNTTIDFSDITVTGWVLDDNVPYSASRNGDTSTGHESYGNYYNWSSSIASNNSVAFSESTFDDITKNPQNSICPRGWRLPTVSSQSAEEEGSTNEFARLNQLYNNGALDTDEGLISAPLYLVRAGYIRFGLHSLDIAGLYWSDTVNDAETAFYLGFHSSTVTPGGSDEADYKSYGRSVRCVARTGITVEPGSDDEDDDTVGVPDTGTNQRSLASGGSSVSVVGVFASGIGIAIFGFVVFSKRRCRRRIIND